MHAITPGDHFSPSTGSAVPTVVDGLARAAAAADAGSRQQVLVASGTYPDRYPSAAVIEYPPRRTLGRREALGDLVGARTGRGRTALRDSLQPMLQDQASWDPAAVLAHNLPELVALVDGSRHRPVLYAHNQLLRTYSPRAAGRLLDPAAAVICVSEFLAEQTRGRLPGRLANRVEVVRNGVDCSMFHPPTGPVGGGDPARLRVVFLGRMVHDKGPDVALEAVGRLSRADVTLTLVGSQGFDAHATLSPFERQLRARAEELAVNVDFRTFTPRPELPALLRSHDVLVAPSRWPEPWGLTIAEGMATGMAVVASAVGGVPEVVGSAGQLVPADDPAALADRLQALAEDRSLLEATGRAARQHALTHDWSWSWAQLCEVLAAVQ